MTVEPRFGTGPRPGGTLGEQLLQGQMDQQKALGRLEAGMDAQKEQGRRIERGLENMGRRLDGKIDQAVAAVEAARSECRQADVRRDERCEDHDRRLSVLEHDKSVLRGASWAMKLLWAALSALGLSGLVLLLEWLRGLLEK